MIYNGVTEYLLQWCLEKREEYFRRNLQERADTGRSLLFVKRSFYDEMAYKLCSLVDMDMEDFDGDGSPDDPMLKNAVELAVETGKISTSLIQRRLSLGYGRAAKLIDRMEQMGYVSAPEGQKQRRVLITKEQYMELVLKQEDII